MKIFLYPLFAVLTLSCSTNKNPIEKSTPDSTNKEFSGLTESEKLGVFSEIGEVFKGDYRKYLGQNEDSTKVQLILNQDKRFALGFKLFFDDKMENGDSIVTFQYSTTSQFNNICIGRWTDEGEMIKLNILLGQSQFFDSPKNDGTVKIVDDKTVLLYKNAKEVWIARALCKMK